MITARAKAYYNEHDPFAAQWLRELIREGAIADGDVDERDIEEVRARDLAGYTQHHFFAGIGGWSLALRLAGWPDDCAVWTGSCPCQPYSAAGRQQGDRDPRNLWPYWYRLIRQSRPDVVVGEQVAQAIGHGWLDTVSTDLEAEGYAVGASVLGAHSVGAFHLRQRLYFVAERVANRDGDRAARHAREEEGARQSRRTESQRSGEVCNVADDDTARRGARGASEARDGQDTARLESARLRNADRLGHADAARSQGRRERGNGARERAAGAAGVAGDVAQPDGGQQEDRQLQRGGRYVQRAQDEATRIWRDVEWLACKDGKYRPTQPGLFPLAHGVPNRVGTLRGAGNAIVPQLAAAFITAYLEVS